MSQPIQKIAAILDDTAPLAPAENESAPLRMTAKRALHVNLRNNAGTEVGTSTDPVSAASSGDVAHDAVDSGNPVKVGGKALTADPTAVATADRVNALFDVLGKQVTLPYSLTENLLSGKTGNITDTADTAVIAAQGAGVRIYVTALVVSNSHATVGTWVNIKDGATTLLTVFVPALSAGLAIPLASPLRLTANTALNAANETTGSNTRVSATGFKA